jgi:hypothetical protein
MSTRSSSSLGISLEPLPRRPAASSYPLESILRRRWAYEAIYLALLLVAAGLVLSVVGRHGGWPLGDAYTNELVLVQLYAAHFHHLDFFPVWSSSDAFGLGSPVLLYYHKAFFYVAAFFYILLGGAMKPALMVSMVLFIVVGAYGMRCALSIVTPSRLLCTAGSIGFVFTNYVFTDWLSRGDLPEFSAMMIVPWLLYWCLKLIKRRRSSLVLIPTMFLLVNAHSATALISLVTVVVALCIFLASAGLAGLRAVLPRLALGVGGATLLLAPTLLAELRMAQSYDPASKVTHYGALSGDFLPFRLYFFDGSAGWLSPASHTFVQIDFAIWMAIIGVLIWLAIGHVRGHTKRESVRPVGIDKSITAFLVVSLVIYLVLQLRVTMGVYDVLSPLKSIDYPFRMLAFITPLGIILLVVLFQPIYLRYHRLIGMRALPAFWLASLVLLSPITATWQFQPTVLAPPGQFPLLEISSVAQTINFGTFSGVPTLYDGVLYGEYLPKVFDKQGTELYDDIALYRRLHQHDHGAASLSQVPCSVQPPARVPLESLELRFHVECAAATRLALPISYSAFTSVSAIRPDGSLRPVRTIHVRSDPRLVVKVQSARSEVLVVHLPTLWGVLWS